MAGDVKDLVERISIGERTVFDVAGTEGERKLTVEQRRLLPEEPRAPKRAESPKRAHEFLSAQSLAMYLAEYGCKATVIYADPVNGVVHAILNEKAERGIETVEMKPAVHPLWAPWADVVGKSMPLSQFVSFIDQHRRSIEEPDGKELSLVLSQIRAAVSVERQHGKGKHALNGIMVTTKIQGQQGSELVELPDELVLLMPLYVQTMPVRIELDLCLDATTEGEVRVLLTAGTVAEARVKAFEDMVDTIRKGTEHLGATHTFGRPKHAAWKYLEELAGVPAPTR